MISFTKPAKLNGLLLIEELLAAGIQVAKSEASGNPAFPPVLDGDGVLWLAIDLKDKNKAQTVLDAHQG